jgi:Lipase (class 3)
VYPGWHNLCARVWRDHNYENVVTLGESETSPHIYNPGSPPAQLPRSNAIVGSASCLASGELVSHALPPAGSVDGFPPACFVPSGLDPEFIDNTDIWRCKNQLWYAQVIELLYANNIGAATDVCRQAFGPAPVITWHPGGSLYPGVLTLVTPSYAVAIAHGTTQYQQVALYSFYGIAPPNNFGIFSTNNAFYSASTYLHTLLVGDGMVAGTPIMLAGHSYGGAMCLLLAARYRFVDATRDIRFLTYGAPKSGDARLSALLGQCIGLAVENDQDFVPLLPPDLSALTPVIAILGLQSLTVWVPWRRCPTTLLQFADGTTAINVAGTMSTATLLAMVQRVLAHLTLFGFPAHPIQEYIARISLRCQNQDFPAAGAIGLGVQQPDKGFGQLGLGVVPGARGELVLAAIPAALGSLGLGLKAIPLGGLGLGLKAIPLGGLGLGVVPAPFGELGLGVVPAPFEGLGLGVVPAPFGELGLNAGP